MCDNPYDTDASDAGTFYVERIWEDGSAPTWGLFCEAQVEPLAVYEHERQARNALDRRIGRRYPDV